MVVVAGSWELGYNTPLVELDQWRFPMRDFGADELAMWPVSGIKSTKVKEFANIDEIIKHYKDLTLVIVDERGDVELEEFDHPENALYVFGKAHYSPIMHKKEDPVVYIKTKENKGLLWGSQAACLVMYNRMKQWH